MVGRITRSRNCHKFKYGTLRPFLISSFFWDRMDTLVQLSHILPDEIQHVRPKPEREGINKVLNHREWMPLTK